METDIEPFRRKNYEPIGFKKVYISHEIGYGIFTTKPFEKNRILLEYKGTLGPKKPVYSLNNKSYIFYFSHKQKNLCIDATYSDCTARFVNDSTDKFANCEVVKKEIDGIPRLFLKAKKFIPANFELRYNYGDPVNSDWRIEKPHLIEPFTLEEVERYQRSNDVKIAKIRPLKASQVLNVVEKHVAKKRRGKKSGRKGSLFEKIKVKVINDEDIPCVVSHKSKRSVFTDIETSENERSPKIGNNEDDCEKKLIPLTPQKKLEKKSLFQKWEKRKSRMFFEKDSENRDPVSYEALKVRRSKKSNQIFFPPSNSAKVSSDQVEIEQQPGGVKKSNENQLLANQLCADIESNYHITNNHEEIEEQPGSLNNNDENHLSNQLCTDNGINYHTVSNQEEIEEQPRSVKKNDENQLVDRISFDNDSNYHIINNNQEEIEEQPGSLNNNDENHLSNQLCTDNDSNYHTVSLEEEIEEQPCNMKKNDENQVADQLCSDNDSNYHKINNQEEIEEQPGSINKNYENQLPNHLCTDDENDYHRINNHEEIEEQPCNMKKSDGNQVADQLCTDNDSNYHIINNQEEIEEQPGSINKNDENQPPNHLCTDDENDYHRINNHEEIEEQPDGLNNNDKNHLSNQLCTDNDSNYHTVSNHEEIEEQSGSMNKNDESQFANQLCADNDNKYHITNNREEIEEQSGSAEKNGESHLADQLCTDTDSNYHTISNHEEIEEQSGSMNKNDESQLANQLCADNDNKYHITNNHEEIEEQPGSLNNNDENHLSNQLYTDDDINYHTVSNQEEIEEQTGSLKKLKKGNVFNQKYTDNVKNVQKANVKQQSSKGESSSKKSLAKRTPHPCPETNCNGRKYPDLPRHMRDKHKWPKHKAKFVTSMYGLRKPYSRKGVNETVITTKPSRKRKWCPFENCYAVTTHMEDHITGKLHRVTAKSKEYYELLKKAQTFEGPHTTVKVPAGLYTTKPSNSLKTHNKPVSSTTQATNQMPDLVSAITELSKVIRLHFSARNQLFESTHFGRNENIDTNQSCIVNADINQSIRPSAQLNENNVQATSNDDSQKQYNLRKTEKPQYNSDDDIEEEDNSKDPTYSPSKDYKHEGIDFAILPGNMKSIFKLFESYLQSVDGGNREEKNRKMISREVERIALAIRASTTADMFDCERIKNRYLSEYCESRNHQPSSIQKYLRSLRDFYDFVIGQNIATGFSVSYISSVRMRCTGWMKTYAKMARKEQFKKDDRDLENLVTPEDVQKYEDSEAAEESKRLFSLLRSTSENVGLTQNQYCSVRDHLYFKLFFNNSHRTGVYANALLPDFLLSKRQSNNKYAMTIFKHKTSGTYGPAFLFMTDETYELMCLYVEKIRSARDFHNSEFLFLTWLGGDVDGGSVSKCINSRFRKAGVVKDINITGNLIRKSTVTGMRNENFENLPQVASQMGHDVSTANKNYRLVKRRHDAAIGSDTIHDFYYRNNEGNSPCSPIKKWLPSEEKDIADVFATEIEKGDVTLETVRTKRDCLSLVDSSISDKQIADKVRRIMISPIKLKKLYVPPDNDNSETEQNDNSDTSTSITENQISTTPTKTLKVNCNRKDLSPNSILMNMELDKRRRKSIFSREENIRLLTKCRALINARSFPKREILNALDGDPILIKHRFISIRTRLEYLSRDIN